MKIMNASSFSFLLAWQYQRYFHSDVKAWQYQGFHGNIKDTPMAISNFQGNVKATPMAISYFHQPVSRQPTAAVV
tara:strand:- start:995 stop:1219 length:225 start_codon:yes stop_codon:yes gene_type:complete